MQIQVIAQYPEYDVTLLEDEWGPFLMRKQDDDIVDLADLPPKQMTVNYPELRK